MLTILVFIIIIAIPSLTFIAYMSVRNGWVLRNRLKILKEGVPIDQRLPSYEYMLWKRWWIWDIHKFLVKKEKIG